MVYKTAKGWAIFIYFTAPLLIALFGWMLLLPFSSSKEIDPIFYFFLCPISLGMIILMVIGLLDTIRGKLIIEKDTIKLRTTLTNRDLKFNEVKGFRTADKYVFILPNREGLKRIKISTYMGNMSQLMTWLYINFPNLDEENFEEEQEAILQNHDFGRNEEERLQQLKEAKKVTSIINWAASGCMAWAFFYPTPYEFSVLACMLFPALCIIILNFYKGLIRIDEKNGSAYPSVLYAIVLPTCALVVRSTLDYNILDSTNIWLPAFVIALVFTLVMVISTREFKITKGTDIFSIAVVYVCLFGFSYSSMLLLNCMYDESEAKQHLATVLDKRISSGKTTTYYLELTAWGPKKEAEDVSVSKEFYNEVQ